LSWAHPEFGQLLATSGADGLAMVWEERADSSVTGSGAGGDTHSVFAAQAPVTLWAERARLADARKSLSCVKFAPRHLRLQLATASADGEVRIYEAVDVMNLNQWLLKFSIEVEPDNTDLGVRCLDWCQGRFEPPTLVVGDSSGNVNIYRYSDLGGNWGLHLRLDGHVNPRRGVLDVSWSPDVGRSYHLISSCGRDGLLRVHKLKKLSNSADGANDSEEYTSQVLTTREEVWRCSWNVTGTVLASSGDGGVVGLWKSDFSGNWKCVSEVKGAPQR